VLIAGDDGVPVRVREELNGAGGLALDGTWRPAAGRELMPGLPVSIVATREACEAMLG
jgi:hypothetical protein